MEVVQEFHISGERGLHARPSARFVALVDEFDVDVSVSVDDETVEGDSLMSLLSLGAGEGTLIKVTARGEGAEAFMDAIRELLSEEL